MKTAIVKERRPSEIPDFCRAMVDGSPMPIAFVDGDSHTIRYVNPIFRLLVGELDVDLIGASFANALPGSSECLSMMDRVNETGRAETYTGQEYFPAHPLYFSYVLWPVLAGGGQRVGIMVQVTETTLFHNQSIENQRGVAGGFGAAARVAGIRGDAEFPIAGRDSSPHAGGRGDGTADSADSSQ